MSFNICLTLTNRMAVVKTTEVEGSCTDVFLKGVDILFYKGVLCCLASAILASCPLIAKPNKCSVRELLTSNICRDWRFCGFPQSLYWSVDMVGCLRLDRTFSSSSKSIHVTFTIRKETCNSPKKMSSILGYTLTGDLPQIHFRKTETTRNHPHQNVLVTRTQVKTLYNQQTSHIWNNTETNLDLRNTTLGYGFHFQHRNSRTFPIESLANDSGRTLVCTKYGYTKGSPNTNS
jgi:hypothetical protein